MTGFDYFWPGCVVLTLYPPVPIIFVFSTCLLAHCLSVFKHGENKT